jgi:hypothetical protein
VSSKTIAVTPGKARRPGGSLLRTALWIYFAPAIVIGVLLIVMFGLALLAAPLGILVGALARAGWH